MVAWHEDLRNIAIWTYFQGGERFPGIDRGNILTEYHEDGWVWVIPFADGTCSVGFVSPYQVYGATRMTPEEYFRAKLQLAPEASRLLAGAVRVAGYRTTKDWSYACRRFGGPGYLLTGDAAAFVDPLFSTGVHELEQRADFIRLISGLAGQLTVMDADAPISTPLSRV